MNKMTLLEFYRSVLHGFIRVIPDFRLSMLSGGLVAMALSCGLSMHVNAASKVGGASTEALAVESSPAVETPASPHVSTLNDSGNTLPDSSQDDPAARPTWSLALALALALSLTVGVAVALVGAYLSRAAIKRVVAKQTQIADQWARRYEAAEARGRTAHATAWERASGIVIPEPFGLPDATRLYLESPLSAMGNLLESVNPPNPSNSSNSPDSPDGLSAQLSTIQYAMRTWSQTLSDLLNPSPLESRAWVIDESVTNLRGLVEAVIALLAPSAMHQGVRVSASVDPAVAETVLADQARLGQLCFHLLARAIQHSVREEIVLAVRTECSNSGSQQQRIVVGVTQVGKENALAAQQQRPDDATGSSDAAGKRTDIADACLPLCRVLAQRMQGGISIASGLDAVARVSFDASFAVVQKRPILTPVGLGAAHESGQTSESDAANTPQEDAVTAFYEPFDQRFLDSLSEEGLDLSIFLDGWRRAMDDDLARLGLLCRQSEPEHIGGVLHRLSGAVGLVGARSLMEALRRASASPLEQNAISIESLLARARNLVKQLEARPAVPRSA